MKLQLVFSAVLATVLLAGCAAKPPKMAQNKTVEIAGKNYVLGGSYNERKNELALFINGDPVMKGSFPPFTPTLNLNAKYSNINVKTHCYFGSVLGKQGGAVGIIAGAIQSSKSKAGDKCDITLDDNVTESLYF